MTERQAEVIWRAVDGRVVGLDLASSRYFSLNDTAALLWRSMEDGVEPARLAQLLIERYGIEQASAEADVAAFLDDLRQGGLLAD